MRFQTFLVTLTVLALAGCGGGSTTSPSQIGSSSGSSSSGSSGSGGTGGSSTPNGTVTFKVDGVQNSASSVTASYTAGILAIGATDAARQTTLGFALSGNQPATFTMGPLSSANALLQVGNPVQGWQAGVGLGSGTITLTTFTPTSASGTFAFTMVPVTGNPTTANRAVTEGTFNVVIR
jgi:hypothetical protein